MFAIPLLYRWLAGLVSVVVIVGGAYIAGYHRADSNARVRALVLAQSNQLAFDKAKADSKDKEAQYLAALEAVQTNYEGVIQHDQAQIAADRAAIAAGRIVLHDPYASDCHSLSETPAASPSRDGQAGGGFSPEATGFLLGEADRADSVIHQLDACQEVIRRYVPVQ